MPPPKNKLLEGPILRSLLALAVPIVAANALQSAYQSLGIKGYWQKRLEFLLRESPAQNLSPMQVAATYTRLDEREKTFAWLERAYQERQGEVVWLKVSPTFNRFRSDPRFANILRRVGFN